MHVAVSHPDGWLFPSPPTRWQQCRESCLSGSGCRLRWDTIAPHQLQRWGLCPANKKTLSGLHWEPSNSLPMKRRCRRYDRSFWRAYAVEALTEEIERKSIEYIEKIEAMAEPLKPLNQVHSGEIGEKCLSIPEGNRNQETDYWLDWTSFRWKRNLSGISLSIKPEVETIPEGKTGKG